MAPGAGFLLRKIQLLQESDAGAAIVQVQVLAAQADMLAELASEEIKGLDCEFDVPGLGIIWNEIQLVKRVATAVRTNGAIPFVELPVQLDACMPPASSLTASQKQYTQALTAQIAQAWCQEPLGLKKCRFYKHCDTLSEHLMSFGQLLDWNECGVWGIVLQRGLGVIGVGESVPEFKRIVDWSPLVRLGVSVVRAEKLRRFESPTFGFKRWSAWQKGMLCTWMFNYFSFGQLDSVHGSFGKSPRNRFSTMTCQACFENTCNLCYRSLAKTCVWNRRAHVLDFSEYKEIFYSKDIRKKHHQKIDHHFVNCMYMKILIYHTVIILFSLFVVFRAQRSGDYTNSSLGAVRPAIQFQNIMQRKANANRCFDSTLLQELIAAWLLTSRPHALMVFNRGFISTHFLFSARCFLKAHLWLVFL